MPDAEGLYSTAEKLAYRPPACPTCGSPQVQVDWINVTGMGGGPTRWMLGLPDCTTLARHFAENDL